MSATKTIPTLPLMPPELPIGRVPPWRLDCLVHRACPVCGADRTEGICTRPDRLVVARCLECGMVHLADIPDERDLATLYHDYSEYKKLPSGPGSWLYRLSPIKPAEPYIEILAESGGLKGRQLCEVGCAKGAFLLRARKAGATVHGVELDADSVRALTGLGIPVEPEVQGGGRFDIVCAFQLLEHLARPAEFVQRAAQALVPGGRLLLALPNGGDAERVGPGWVGYRVDLEHLNYFSVATLARLLSAHGLYVEQFWECLQPNLPRVPAVTRPGLGRRAQEWLGGMLTPRWHRGGSFNLVVLARKVPASL